MTTDQFKYFLSLVRTRNFTKSATELQISVSTLSRQIAAMEEELKFPLFHRTNTKVEITKSGEHFAQQLAPIYQSYQDAVLNTQKFYKGYNEHISCGILEDITLNGVLQDNFFAFSKKHPNWDIHLQRDVYQNLVNKLQTGEYDCMITFLFAILSVPNLKYKIVEHIVEGILIASKHPLAKKETFDPLDFKDETFFVVASDENPYISSLVPQFFQQYGFYPKITYAPNIDVATLWVEAGFGVSFSYHKSIGSYNPALKFLPAKEGNYTGSSKLVLSWVEDNESSVLRQFVKEFSVDK